MTARIETAVIVRRPRAEVFERLARLEAHADWMGDAASITFLTAQRQGVGTEMIVETRVGPLRSGDRMRITEWRADQAIGISHLGEVRGNGIMELSDYGAGWTLLRWTERLSLPARFGGGLGEFVAAPVLRRIFRADLARFARLVESEGGLRPEQG
ncbi:MAG: SRPBCC family protein [Nitrospiraceae bacterium]|nr:SRPBCC family protein [Nitrospiraceae bacterium]MDA8208309.1 SRPBCC family protein [Actinomycetota bacterium]